MSTETIQLIQFAKWPVKGRVKTRLAKSIGDEEALAAHKHLLNFVLNQLVNANVGDVALWFDLIPGKCESGGVTDECATAGVQINEQVQGDLGKKMQHALSAYLPCKDKIILVGSDCPTICSGYLNAAVAALDHHDIVIGPAEDGGYVLIGVSGRMGNQVPDAVFEDIPWGTPQVLSKTKQKLHAAEMGFFLLDEAWDVDEIEDWQRFIEIKKERPYVWTLFEVERL